MFKWNLNCFSLNLTALKICNYTDTCKPLFTKTVGNRQKKKADIYFLFTYMIFLLCISYF